MPRYQAKLSDGRTVLFEADEQPSEDDILGAVGHHEDISNSARLASSKLSRPPVKLDSGELATVRSIGVGDDKGEWVIPTIVDGKPVSQDDAIKLWRQGKNQPIGGPFKDQSDADLYAKQFHEAEQQRLDVAQKGIEASTRTAGDVLRNIASPAVAMASQMGRAQIEKPKLQRQQREAQVAGDIAASEATSAGVGEQVAEFARTFPQRAAKAPFELAQAAGIPIGKPTLSHDDIAYLRSKYAELQSPLTPPQPAGPKEQAITDWLNEQASGMTSPEMVAAVGTPMAAKLAKMSPEAIGEAGRLIARGFQAQMAAGVPEAVQATVEAPDTPSRIKAGLSATAAVGLPLAIEAGLTKPTPKIPDYPGSRIQSPERGVVTALGNEEMQAEAKKQAAMLELGRSAAGVLPKAAEELKVKAQPRIEDVISQAEQVLELARSVNAPEEAIKNYEEVVRRLKERAGVSATPSPVENVVPAIKTMSGEVVAGEKGQSHNDIIEQNKIPAKEVDRREFVDTATGQEVSREKLATAIPTKKEGEAHSSDLAKAQEAEPTLAPPPPATETAPPAVPPPLPKLVSDALSRSDRDANWVWMHATKEEKAAVDKWVVDTKHPLATQPGTAEGRFKALVQENIPKPPPPTPAPVKAEPSGGTVTVFHGSDTPFDKFDPSKVGSRTDPGFAGRGAYTTTDPAQAGRWGKNVLSTTITGGKWLKIKGISELTSRGLLEPMSPAENALPEATRKAKYAEKINRFTDKMLAEGYDGVEWTLSNGQKQYVLFRPENYDFKPQSEPSAPPPPAQPKGETGGGELRLTPQQMASSKTKIRKGYNVKRPVTDEEARLEIANLLRKEAKGNLDDSQERLLASLRTGKNPIPEPPTPPPVEQKGVEPEKVATARPQIQKGITTAALAEGEILEGTALKNATAEAERIGLNLPKHYEPAAHEMLTAVDQAMRLERENPGAGERLGDELIANPEMGLNDVQSALLLRRKVDLFRAVNDAAERTHIGDEASRKSAQAQHDELAVKLTNLLDAIRFRGSEWGREGRWRQAMMREDYSFDSIDNIERYKRTVSPNPFTPEEKKAAENFADRVKKANDRAEKISSGLDKSIRRVGRQAETDAEKRALDAASKTVRENAIRLTNAEKKLRVAKTVRDYETAQIQVKTAKEALDQSVKTRDDAVKAARAESQARVDAAVKAKDLAEEQEAAADKAHKAALDAVRNAAAELRKAEGKERIKAAKLARDAAQIQAKAAAKALDAAAKRRTEASLKMVKEERRNLGDPMGAVWRKAREYLDKGVENMDDIRKKVATDLGMSVEQVVRWMARDKKTKFLADELWRQQKIARELRLQAKRWVDNLDRTRAEKLARGTPTFFFRAKTAGHGGVALGTHAPGVLYQPKFWGVYSKNFVDMHHMVFSDAYYESKMNELVRSENWAKANRAGLVNDPRQFEEFAVPGAVYEGKGTISKEFLEKWNTFTGAGNRGYAVLKLLRQDMFDQMWNNLPKSKQLPEVAKALADDINHITGVVKGSPPKGSNIALFAPRLLASRVMTLAADPAKAAWYFINWKDASTGQRMFAMNQLKGKMWMLATGFSLLAANQGILTALGSKQKINGVPKALGGAGFDPMESDFLKFKGLGYAGSYGNAMISMGLLPLRVAMAVAYQGKSSKLVLEDERVDKVIGDYLRSQAAPFAGTMADLTFGRDFQGRPLKRKLMFTMEGDKYIPKRLQKHDITKPYGWFEYGSQAIAPIPLAEPLKELFQTGVGLSEKQIRQMGKASAIAVLQAGTGGRLVEDPRLKK